VRVRFCAEIVLAIQVLRISQRGPERQRYNEGNDFMGDEQNGSGKSRLDRLEGLMELLIDDHLRFSDDLKQLLTAQVLLTDAQRRTEENVQKIAAAQKELTEALAAAQKDLRKELAELAEAQKHTDERLNALINVVDDLVRNRPPQAPQ
jgi:seryl-tRNA synthetase